MIPMVRTPLPGADLEDRSPFWSSPSRAPGGAFPSAIRPLLLLLATAALLSTVAGCEEDVTLIDPGPFFAYEQDNAWASTCTGPRSPRGAAPREATPPRAVPPPAAVPPPSGLLIEACPNPAPPGTREITFHFRLNVRRPSVNLGIVNDRGLVVARLLEDYSASADADVEVEWLLDGVSPGDYRAYFLADDIESSGDLRVE